MTAEATVDSEITTLRVVNDPLGGDDGAEAFRETFGRKILGIEIDPLDGHPLEIDLTLRALPGFAMASGSLSPMHNRHTAALIDNDDVVLVVMQSGAGEVSQHGRTATVAEGEAVLTANGTVATFSANRPTSVINLRLSRNFWRRILPISTIWSRGRSRRTTACCSFWSDTPPCSMVRANSR
jgi:hypothetical protein